MKHTKDRIKQLLQRDIDSSITIGDYSANLSVFFKSAYNLYQVNILRTNLIFAEPSHDENDMKSIVKGVSTLESEINSPVIIVRQSLTNSNRSYLIRHGQGFVTLDGDYYLPQLALKLSLRAKSNIFKKRMLSPVQQQLFLYCLYNDSSEINQVNIQNDLNISAGSVSTGLNALVNHRILDFTVEGKTGRKKRYFIDDKNDYFNKGIKIFGNPIKEKIYISSKYVTEKWPLSGITALSKKSNLVTPKTKEYAVNKLNLDRMSAITNSDDVCIVYVLKYNPMLFVQNNCVDPVTMLLTIDDWDERIVIAVNEAMKGYKWFKDWKSLEIDFQDITTATFL